MLPALFAVTVGQAELQRYTFKAPAADQYAVIRPGGTTILPNGRFLTPKGERRYAGTDLFHVAVPKTGKAMALFSSDAYFYYPNRDDANTKPVQVKKTGIAPTGVFLKDGKRMLISLGDAGSVEIVDAATGTQLATTLLPAVNKDRGYANDIVLSPDEKYAYIADVAIQRIITLSLPDLKVLNTVEAGRQPYGLGIAKDGSALYVANIGIFDYSVIPNPTDGKGDPAGITLPPFAFPSKESMTGVQMEGRFVPGIGDPRTPDAQSVFTYALSDPSKPYLKRKTKSGLLIHAPADGGKAVGGSSPNAVLVHGSGVYVTNANSDTVQIFSRSNMELKRTIKLTPHPYLARLRGVIPSGMAMSQDGSRLYVCESGLNSVAVLDPVASKVLYRIPTGWFPVSLKLVDNDRTLVIGTQKGLGRGPQGALDRRPETDERFGMSAMPGLAQVVKLPTNRATQRSWTNEVLRNNGIVAVRGKNNPANPIPVVPGKPSDQIKYVVFITKENHTFDGIFGGFKGAKSRAEYAEFGNNGWIRENGKEKRVPIMPNHWKLAEQWAISDNFYMEPQASGDGHRWLVGVYPSLWTTRVFYAGWDFKRNDTSKGRLTSIGSNGSQIPEDYLENGSMWEHLDRGGVTFRNYGEGFEFPGQLEPADAPRSGSILQVNHPLNAVLWNNTCWEYPVYNNDSPDIARGEWFIEDVENNYRKPGKPLPKFMNITLPNDHGAGKRPDDGYPYLSSFMADNDLALGQLLEYLSKQPEWKNMAVFVTQDDSGGDDDMVDRHRSFVLALGPYAKRGYVSHEHTSIMSILKTIYLIFGLGPNNMFDALATDLSDMFTAKPDYTPYRHLNSDPAVFVADAAFRKDDPKYKERRFMKPSIPMDDPKWFDELRKSKVKSGSDDDDDDNRP